MKTRTLLLLLLACWAGAVQAQAILRVNNNTGVSGPGIYSTIQAAHNAATAGDVIYVEPSAQSYGDLVCTKRLTIIGNGYFLTGNTGLQLDARPSQLGNVSLVAGSAGSRLTGCQMSGANMSTNNLTVERNYITGAIVIGQNQLTGVASGAITQAVIRQNYVGSLFFNVDANSSANNVIIIGNIVYGGISVGTPAHMSAVLKNNIIGAGGNYSIDIVNSILTNNILLTSSSTFVTAGRNNVYNNNISEGPAFGTQDGNQSNIPASSMLVGNSAPSTDGAFQLKTGTNPARGSGENGADVGAFGGTAPYKLSGIPNVPTIYQYTQTVTGASLNAVISTKSND